MGGRALRLNKLMEGKLSSASFSFAGAILLDKPPSQIKSKTGVLHGALVCKQVKLLTRCRHLGTVPKSPNDGSNMGFLHMLPEVGCRHRSRIFASCPATIEVVGDMSLQNVGLQGFQVVQLGLATGPFAVEDLVLGGWLGRGHLCLVLLPGTAD